METLLCTRCRVNPRPAYHSYCSDCKKAYRREHPEDRSKKYKRVSPFPEMCGKCHQRPHSKGHAWCQECKNEASREWWARNPDWNNGTPGRRIKYLARHLVNLHLKRGKIRKLPCLICGSEIVTAHHYLGYEKPHTTDIIWLCWKHHLEAEKKLWSPIVPQDYRSKIVAPK